MELADDDDPSGRWCTVCFAAQKQTGLRSCHSGDRGLAQQECTVRRRGRNRAVIPGNTGQLHDGGPSAARTALAYAKQKDEMYIFQGGNYTPDNIQDLFRGLGSDTAILLDGGGHRRSFCAVIPGACGPALGRRKDRATPVRCSVTPMSGRCPAGWRSTKASQRRRARSRYTCGVKSSEVMVVILVTSHRAS